MQLNVNRLDLNTVRSFPNEIQIATSKSIVYGDVWLNTGAHLLSFKMSEQASFILIP